MAGERLAGGILPGDGAIVEDERAIQTQFFRDSLCAHPATRGGQADRRATRRDTLEHRQRLLGDAPGGIEQRAVNIGHYQANAAIQRHVVAPQSLLSHTSEYARLYGAPVAERSDIVHLLSLAVKRPVYRLDNRTRYSG